MSSFEGTYVIKKASDAAEALDKNIINETIWDEISFEMSEPLTPSCTGKVSLKCHVFPSIVDSTVDSPVTFEFGFGALKEGTLNMTTHMGNRADDLCLFLCIMQQAQNGLAKTCFISVFTCLIPLLALSIFRLYLENQMLLFSFASRKKRYLESFQVICTALDNNIYLLS